MTEIMLEVTKVENGYIVKPASYGADRTVHKTFAEMIDELAIRFAEGNYKP